VPDVYPSAGIDGAKDEFTDGASNGTLDLFAGEPQTIRFLVKNQGTAAASNVDVVVSLDGVTGSDYLIESDWQHPGTFAENDANQAAENPAHGTALKGLVAFKMNALSPNETKRITIPAADDGYSIGNGMATHVRIWVRDVPSYYHQDDFDGPSDNANGSQTFNQGKLQVEAPFEVYSRVHWEFDADETEGWSPLGAATLTPAPGDLFLGLASTGDDPGALGPATAFAADAYGAVTLRARRSGGTGDAKLYFATDTEPAMSEDKAVAFELPDDGDFHEVTLDMTGEPKWVGTITQLRLDPFESGEGDVAIDYVRAGTDVPSGGGGAGGGFTGEPPATGAGGADAGSGGSGGDGVDALDGTAADAGCTCGVVGPSEPAGSGLGAALFALAAVICTKRRRRTPSC
jgi:hypothetical protein